MQLIERYYGALLGLAAGDAVGTTIEFRAPGSFAPINNMLGGGPFGLAAGEWTDDTSMALCLAESLVECAGFDPVDQLRRYVRWYREGYLSSNGRCFDIGNTVASALRRFERTGEPYPGETSPNSAGNGSIMRLAPVPLAYAHTLRDAIYYSGLSSQTTHNTVAAIDGCRYLGALIVGALRGMDKASLLAPDWPPELGLGEQAPLTAEIAEIAAGSFKQREPPQIVGSGYVVRSLEAALWAFWRSESFEQGCLLAVNLGDDADTTGAVYGQLAGAYYGISEIPPSWRKKLAHSDLIASLAKRLYELAARLPIVHS